MTKLIVRVMEGDPESPEHGQMLGWQQVDGLLRGDGQVSTDRPIQVPIETAGIPRYVSVHWVDVNVELRLPIVGRGIPVAVGAVVPAFPAGPVFRVGPQVGGLPPIVTRSPVTVTVSVGAMGATGSL